MRLADDQVTTAEVRDWRGLHLLHFATSSCSQKVRILLGEKGIDWISHPVNLARHENATPWFLGINPRGVVPVLVHDGVVHVESNDIMEYLDTQVPSAAPPLLPRDEAERQIARASLAREDALHHALRTITMGFLVPVAAARKPSRTLETYEHGGAADEHRTREVAWWRDFARQGVPRADALAAAAAFAAAFAQLDADLGTRSWLLGERISVLEIAWFISLHRLVLAGYPVARHARLEAHYARLRQRPAFAREIGAGGAVALLMRAYARYRRLTRSTLAELLAAGDAAGAPR